MSTAVSKQTIPGRKPRQFAGQNRLPERRVRLPLINEKEGIEVIRMEGEEAFVISREVNGRYGFPNNFIEKELSVLATTRNWNTITRMINPKVNA